MNIPSVRATLGVPTAQETLKKQIKEFWLRGLNVAGVCGLQVSSFITTLASLARLGGQRGKSVLFATF